MVPIRFAFSRPTTQEPKLLFIVASDPAPPVVSSTAARTELPSASVPRAMPP